jgi:hypothetical protein
LRRDRAGVVGRQKIHSTAGADSGHGWRRANRSTCGRTQGGPGVVPTAGYVRDRS